MSMALTSKASTTRILTLIALVMAAGVLSLRSLDLFTAGHQPTPTGSQAEQSLINLLEPITGTGNVRVSIQGAQSRTILVLINSDQTPDAINPAIEDLVSAATRFDAETDTLKISQFVFVGATGGNLTALEMAEFLALGLLCTLLVVALVSPDNQASPMPRARSDQDTPVPTALKPPRQTAILGQDTSIDRAAQLAAADPGSTAQVIRRWISNNDGGNA